MRRRRSKWTAASYDRQQLEAIMRRGHPLVATELARYLSLGGPITKALREQIIDLLAPQRGGGRPRHRVPLTSEQLRRRQLAVRLYRAAYEERRERGDKRASDAAFAAVPDDYPVLKVTEAQLRRWVAEANRGISTRRKPPAS